MRVEIDIKLKGDQLFKYLKANKSDIIKKKKSKKIILTSKDYVDLNVKRINLSQSTKAFKTTSEIKKGTIRVKVIANMSMYSDSYKDVLANNSFKKTVRENGPNGKNIVKHLKDHNHKTASIIGKTQSLYGQMIPLEELGIESDIDEGMALIQESDVFKSLDEKAYELYRKDMVNQHSIAIIYVKIELAINSDDEDYKKEKKVWNKRFSGIINKENVLDSGYFWYVSEYKLLENSMVLWGANPITNTLATMLPSSEPSDDTPKESLSSTRKRRLLTH